MTRAMGIGSKAAALHDESCAALRPADLQQLDLRALPGQKPLCWYAYRLQVSVTGSSRWLGWPVNEYQMLSLRMQL